MFCIYCGAKIPDDSLFCEKCGKKLTFASNHKADEQAVKKSAPNAEAAREITTPPQAESFPQAEPSLQTEPILQPSPGKTPLEKQAVPKPSPARLRHTVAAVLVLVSPLAVFWKLCGGGKYWPFFGRVGQHLTIWATLFCFLFAVAAVLLFRVRAALPRKKLAIIWGGIDAAGLIIFYILYSTAGWRAGDFLISMFVYCLILTAVGAALLWWDTKGKK